MNKFRIGDIVGRKSYGGDVYFTVSNITTTPDGKPVYHLRGLLYRIHADSDGNDLVLQRTKDVYAHMFRYSIKAKRHVYTRKMADRSFFLNRARGKAGKILHIDSSQEFLDKCLQYYKEEKVVCYGIRADESEQPEVVYKLLQRYSPEIIVMTGHDSLKKGADRYSIDSYAHSRYFIDAVKEARRFEASPDKLCVYAGACQSYYEAIMAAGANFASSPGRILINCYDPAFVSEKIASTDSNKLVTPQEISEITISGRDGIWGNNTRGQLTYQ